MFSIPQLATLGFLVPFALAWPSPNHSKPQADIANGTVNGFYLPSYNQDLFLGIPYAQPPVGPLRYSVPQSLNSSYSSPLEATAYYPECIGYGGDDIGYEESEDCLALNVIRPAGCEGQKLPVAVWIHGGGNQMGGTVDRRYNLSFIVSNSVNIGKPIIGVSIAYRLASWGFLYSQEVQDSGQTNLGLRDQRLALHWLQENIEAFGGDPSKVTIWGESAGAYSVGAHLVAYGGRDDKLFRAGIMESGNPVNYGPYRPAAYFQPLYDAIVNQTGCTTAPDSLNCLRQLPFATLNAVLNQTTYTDTHPFEPIIDGDFIQNYTSLQLASGAFVHVPIISGANTDEGTAFAPQLGINTTAEFKSYLTDPDTAAGAKGSSFVPVPPSFADELLAAYPDTPDTWIPPVSEIGYGQYSGLYGAQYRRVAAYAGDQVFIAGRRLTCQTWAASGVEAYCYRFNAIPAGTPATYGVTHFQEVAFVFDNIEGLGYAEGSKPFEGKPASYRELARVMSCSWANFVSDLDPNEWRTGAGIVGEEWPLYGDGALARNMVWDANVTSYSEADTWRQEGIDVINSGNLLYLR